MRSFSISRALFVVIFMVCETLLILSIFNISEREKRIILDNNIEKLHAEYMTVINSLTQLADTSFKGFVDTPEVQEAFAQKNRPKLQEILSYDYPYLQNLGFTQVHFHLPDNTSFLRMHKPAAYGDDLSGYRYSVEYVNRQKKQIYGLETGRVVPGFRNVYPMFYDADKYIGSVELSFGVEKLIDDFERVFNVHAHFLMKKDTFDKSVFEGDRKYYKLSDQSDNYVALIRQACDHKNLDYTPKIQKDIEKGLLSKQPFNVQVDLKSSHFSPNPFILSFMPIENIQKDELMYFVFYEESPLLRNFQEDVYSKIVIYSFFLIIIFVLIFFGLLSREKVMKERSKYKDLLKNATDGVHILDMQGKVIDCSESFANTLGYSIEEAKELNVLDFDITLDEQRMLTLLRQHVQYPSKFQTKHQKRDGSVIDVSITTKAIEMDGKTYIYNSARDVTQMKKAQKDLELYKRIFDATDVGITVADMNQEDQPLIFINQAFCTLSGYDKDEVIGQNCRFLQGDDRDQESINIIRESIKYSSTCSVELRNYKKDGGLFWNNLILNPLFDADGNVEYYVGVQHDITQQKLLNEYLKKLIDTLDNIVVISNNTQMHFANQMFFKFFGYEDIQSFYANHGCICELFLPMDRFFHLGKVEDSSMWISALMQLPENERVVSMMSSDYTPHAFSVNTNKFDEKYYIMSFTDISETVMESMKLQVKSTRDTLTGAYNREYFEQNYKKWISLYTSGTNHLGIALFDLDHFKSVNDTHGHDIGDKVLIHFVKTLQKATRNEDTLLRWGGEEFVMVLRLKDKDDLFKVLDKLRSLIAQSDFPTIKNQTCSIGGAIYQKGEEISDTIKRADEAVYEAKAAGRNRVVVH